MIPTVWSLFFESEALPAGALRRIEESREFEKLREKLRGEVDPSFWTSASVAMGDGLRSMLDASLLEILLRAWCTHPNVQRQLETDAGSSEIVLLDLGEHEIVSRHHPLIEIRAGSRKLGALEFDVHLDLMVQLGRLQLEDRRLMRGTLGACTGCGWLRLGDEEIASFRSREIDTPSQISFGAGLVLPQEIEAER